MSRNPFNPNTKESVIKWWKNYLDIKHIRKEETENPDDAWYSELETMKPREHALRLLELYSIFPEAKNLIKKRLKEEKKSLCARIQELSEIYMYEKNQEGIASDHATRELFSLWAQETQNIIKQVVRKEKSISFYLYAISHPPSKGDQIAYRNMNEEIKRAKEVSIESLYTGALRENHLTFSGTCEFHEDKTPSFVIFKNNNRWWCFAEQRGGDSIEYIMIKYNYSFKDALTFLCQK